jgi:hypothetical protein
MEMHVGQLWNNRTDTLKSVIQLITQWKCYHLQSGPLPNPYTAPWEFSTVGSNAAGPFLIASSLPPLLLPSLHLWTWNRFFWMQTWSLEVNKSHTGLGHVNRVDVPTQGSCSRLDRHGVVCRCIVMVKNPWAVLPYFRSFSSYPFMKGCQYLLILDLGDGLTQSVWKVPRISKKKNDHTEKNHDSLQVITFPKKSASFSTFWRMLAQMFIQVSFCSGVRILGIIFKHTFFV